MVEKTFDSIYKWNLVEDYLKRKNFTAWKGILNFILNKMIFVELESVERAAFLDKVNSYEKLYKKCEELHGITLSNM